MLKMLVLLWNQHSNQVGYMIEIFGSFGIVQHIRKINMNKEIENDQNTKFLMF